MPGPVTTPVPLPARLTRSLNEVGGVGAVGGGAVGGVVTVIDREQEATRSPLVTRTVASNTPGDRKVCAGFGFVEDSASPNVHENTYVPVPPLGKVANSTRRGASPLRGDAWQATTRLPGRSGGISGGVVTGGVVTGGLVTGTVAGVVVTVGPSSSSLRRTAPPPTTAAAARPPAMT